MIDLLLTHKAALAVAGAWAYREAHLLWGNRLAIRASLASVYAFLSREGGWWGVLTTITVGKKPAG